MYYIYLFCLLFGLSTADETNTSSLLNVKDLELNRSSTTLVSTTVSIKTPATTPESHSNSTKILSTVSDTTTKPSTTASIPPSSATIPASTTPASTTPASTTPASTTSASTTPASTTGTPATSTTPAPTSEVWAVTDESDNITCIVAKMDISLTVHTGNETQSFKGNPKITKAGGDCGGSIQHLKLFLFEKNNSATLQISFNGTEKNYYISELLITLLINSSTPANVTDALNHYETAKNTSYSCPSYTAFKELEDNKTTVELNLNNIQFEAFRSIKNSIEFSSANHCAGGEVPDIVPLIVGLALAGLVVVVVIGYFIGRRRSQARGYLSM